MNVKQISKYFNHVASQTDYRDESIQTDPYSPAYIISNDGHPEVFSLSDFTYGNGLPATSFEISFIERLRTRREWEKDHDFDKKRMELIIEREMRQWQVREKEINLIQHARQRLYKNNLKNLINIDEDLMKCVFDFWLYRSEKQLSLERKNIEINSDRDLRRIQRNYRLRKDLVHSMKKYKYLTKIDTRRNGTDCFQFDYLFERRLKKSEQDIFEFEKSLPKHIFDINIERFNSLMILQTNSNKKLKQRIANLEKAYHLIQINKTKELLNNEKKPLRFLEKIEKIESLKQSQTVLTTNKSFDLRRIAIIQLQNVLRSIIVQSKIAEIQIVRQDLLNELRKDVDSIEHEMDTSRTEIIDYLEGVTIGDMLDFLSKELIRLQCEQAIHLFIFLADRYRFHRETSETNYRIKLLQRRILEDRVFHEIFSLNSNCDIETYVHDLILQSISNVADEQTRIEIKQITEKLINFTDELHEKTLNQYEIELIVSDLVHNFLFPTIEKILSEKHKPIIQKK